jgi:hypothetical protein
MKTIYKFVVLLGALALGTTVACAASSAESIHVNIPFAFVLAGKVFPAGEYTVQETDTGMILVQGSGLSAVALTVPASPMKEGSTPALHFTASNGHEYLVAVDSESMRRTVPMRSLETHALSVSH